MNTHYRKLCFVFVLILITSFTAKAQIFKDWEWGDATEVYNENGTRISISFYKSATSCETSGKANRFRFNIEGTLQQGYVPVNIVFDYLNCQGNTVTITQSLNIGSGGQLGNIESIDYKFSGTSIVKIHRVVAGNYNSYSTQQSQGQRYSFFDDFTDDRNGWGTYTDNLRTLKISGSKYIISPQAGFSQTARLCNLPIDKNKDFSCEVIAKWINGVTNQAYGLEFSGNSNGEFYFFGVSANGSYILWSLEGGKWTTVIDWTSSSLINQNAVPNILRVNRDGNYVSLFINDTMVKKLPFDGGYGSCFGMCVITGDKGNGTQTVEFSNFKLNGYRK